MPSSYTSNLRLTLPVQGELSGTWGDTVNTGITSLVDTAIAGTASISVTSADVTLTSSNGVADQARSMVLNLTGTSTGPFNVICPASSKLYVVRNNTSGGFAHTIKTSAGTGISVPNGKSVTVYCDGTNVLNAADYNPSLTLGTALPASSGGTGLTSPGTAGNVLTSTGTGWATSVLPAGGITYVVKTSNYTAADKDGIVANTTGGSFTVTLPATPSTGAQVVIADGGSWGTNNLTVGRNGSTIEGLAEDLTLDISGASVQFVYTGTTWEIYAQVGGQGGTVVTETGTQTLTNKTMDYNSNTFTNFPAPTPFSNSTALAQVQAIALSF